MNFETILFVKRNITIFLTFQVLMLLFWSCNSTKYVPENEFLLTKNSFEMADGKSKKEVLNPYVTQKPNSSVLKLPFRLWFYNLGNKDYEKKWDDKILKYKDSNHLFTKIFSLKQSVGWANFNKDINKWIFKNGEEPVLLDTKKTLKTTRTLKRYFLNEGFFKAKVGFRIDTLSPKKAKVVYQINKDKAFVIDTIAQQIASPIIDSLYQLHSKKTFVKTNERFKASDFEQEAERLTEIFRNAGVYHFSKFSISFRDIDSTRLDFKTNVRVSIADRFVEEGDSLVGYPYQIYTIKKVKIITDYSYFKRHGSLNDSLHYKDLDFYAYSHINYKPKYLSRSIFIKPGQKYSDDNNELTRKHIRELNDFTSVRINYEEIEKNQLIAHILLTPSKRYGSKIEAEAIHSNQKPLGISGKLSFKNNNTFKGNEIFQIGLQGSFINSLEFDEGSFFNALELGIDVSYRVPRLVLPFKSQKLAASNMSPKTIFTLGTSLQKNIGLDKERFTGIIEYNWKPNKKVTHTIELINAQYIKNLNVESFFNVYPSEFRKLESIQSMYYPDFTIDEQNALTFIDTVLQDSDFEQNNPDDFQIVQNINKRYDIITEDVLVPAISYELIYNTQTSFKDNTFSHIRMRFASSGLLTSLLTKKTDDDSPKQILGTNVAQYFKLDLEFRKHWHLGGNRVLAYRSSLGIAIPYGNSSSIPFSRSYFAGGPNDIRAWRIYELGPGSENSGLEFNVGNLKLLNSFEYRFDIMSSIKGALFVDTGNIWDISNSDITSDEARFNGFKSFKDIAIGSGFGIRYDFSFLVFRADLGFKTYEPYNISGEKWFQKESLKKPVLNIGINYPF